MIRVFAGRNRRIPGQANRKTLWRSVDARRVGGNIRGGTERRNIRGRKNHQRTTANREAWKRRVGQPYEGAHPISEMVSPPVLMASERLESMAR